MLLLNINNATQQRKLQMNAITSNETTAIQQTFKVDPHKGQLLGTVSSQWFTRPDDQKFLSLADLETSVLARSSNAKQEIVDVSSIQLSARSESPDSMMLEFNGDTVATPTHWSFGQLSSLAGAPAGYLRKLPGVISAINLQYGLQNLRSENVKMFYNPESTQLLAATGVEYGRVFDYELVRAVRKIAGNGTGDTRWKVPGAIDWATYRYNPYVDISQQTTTLYASDRDVFMFLVDDTHPIEIGKLPDGNPDLVFRGFYVWNSEVGSKTLGISTFLFRAVCQNRNIWGAQDIATVTIRHSKNAPQRFADEVEPALLEYSNASDRGVVLGIQQAKQAIVAKTDEDRLEFLGKRNFSIKQAQRIIDTVVHEEGHKPASVWDFVQGITAVARDIGHTDERITLERTAGNLLTKAIH
jgi:hypothetical protein